MCQQNNSCSEKKQPCTQQASGLHRVAWLMVVGRRRYVGSWASRIASLTASFATPIRTGCSTTICSRNSEGQAAAERCIQLTITNIIHRTLTPLSAHGCCCLLVRANEVRRAICGFYTSIGTRLRASPDAFSEHREFLLRSVWWSLRTRVRHAVLPWHGRVITGSRGGEAGTKPLTVYSLVIPISQLPCVR